MFIIQDDLKNYFLSSVCCFSGTRTWNDIFGTHPADYKEAIFFFQIQVYLINSCKFISANFCLSLVLLL